MSTDSDVRPGLLRAAADELRSLADQHRGIRRERALTIVRLIEKSLKESA